MDTAVFRSSDPSEIAQAMEALRAAGVAHAQRTSTAGGVKSPRRTCEIVVSAADEAAAFAALEAIPSEVVFPAPYPGRRTKAWKILVGVQLGVLGVFMLAEVIAWILDWLS